MQQHRERLDSSKPPSAYADRVWLRFTEMFGARFAEQFGPKPSESWREAVEELRPEQVRGALSHIRNSGSPHPPSLPEFVAMARGVHQPPAPAPAAQFDEFHCLGQRTLLRFLMKRPVDTAVTESQLQRLIAKKNLIVGQHRATGDYQPAAEWHELMMGAFARELA